MSGLCASAYGMAHFLSDSIVTLMDQVRRLTAAPQSREAAAEEAATLPPQPGGADGVLPTSRRVSLQPPIPEGSVQEEAEEGSQHSLNQETSSGDPPDVDGAGSGGNSSE